MKNIVFALILSLIIHILFLATTKIDKTSEVKKSRPSIEKKQLVTYVTIKQKKPEVIPEVKPIKKLTKKIVKKENPPKQKTIKKAKLKKVGIKKNKPIGETKTPKKGQPKLLSKTVVKPKKTEPISKKVKKAIKKKTLITKKINTKDKSLDELSKKAQKNTLESFLSTPNLNKDLIDEVTKSYLDLYGDEFNSFTKVQKVFLRKNLKGIGNITQRYMWYPRVSVRTKQAGTNVVEFTLYPNGDISSILLTTSSGYEALDKSSVGAIEIAYKDYPKPRVATKIKIYMNYILY